MNRLAYLIALGCAVLLCVVVAALVTFRVMRMSFSQRECSAACVPYIGPPAYDLDGKHTLYVCPA